MRYLYPLLLAVLLFPAAPVLAQPKPGYLPSSTHVFPAGGRRGSTVAVRVGAECLPPGANFYLTGQGVTAKETLGAKLPAAGEPSLRRLPTEVPITYPNQWQSEVQIAADAPLGTTYWRLSCAQGGTASRPFIVGDLPEWIERESNSTPARAETVTLPVTLNGQISGERDVDYYRFSAAANQTVVCEVLAGRLGSRLDPILEIFDLAGRRVDTEETHVGSDPVLAFRADAGGDFLLRISNVTVHGSPAHVYRINLTTSPYVRYAFPPGGQAGTVRMVELHALSGNGQSKIIKQKVAFPASAAGTFIYRDEKLPGGRIRLAVDTLPNVIEQEPNSSDTAMKVALPVTINGRFETRDDEDWFAFQAKKNERLTIRCRAFPQTGAALPTLLLTNAAGKQLAKARSVETSDGVCRIEWRCPADATYRLRTRDLQYGAAGGTDFIYRLTIQPARGDFALSIASDCFNVTQGGKAPLQINVRRDGGFIGPIDLTLIGLPKGVKLDPLQIPANKSSVKINVTAADDVPAASYTLQVIGKATVDGKAIEHAAQARHLGVDSEGIGVAGATIDRLHLTVQHKPLFRLFCNEAYLYAYRGSVFPYLMEVERLDGFDGPITLQIGDRQNRDLDGIQMHEVVIPPGKSQTRLPIYLPETMHINVQSQSQLYSQAYATFTDKQGRQQSVLVLSEKRNMLRTLPTVVKLRAVETEMTAKAGQKITCRFRLQRTSNFPGAMQLELLEPASASGIVGQEITIAAGASQAQMQLHLELQQPPTKPIRLKFRATGKLGNDIIISEDVVILHVE